jgi:hypothetical protein
MIKVRVDMRKAQSLPTQFARESLIHSYTNPLNKISVRSG